MATFVQGDVDFNVKQKFLNIQMKKRLNEFSVVTNLKVFCGTFNTNAREMNNASSLHDWLTPEHQEMADVYAIGFQEIVPLNPTNVALSGSQSATRAVYWQEQVQACLDSSNIPYLCLVERHLVGILLLIFVRVSLHPQISDVRTAAIGVGMLGVMGNKGGVSVRLTVYESSICFVCAHLQANREAVIGRNSDYRNIIEKIIFVPSPDSIDRIVAQRDSDRAARRWSYADWLETCTILDHDFVFWLGDLNYRIDEQVPTERVFAWCHSRSWEMMRDVDQLNIERFKGTVFNGFHEAPLCFPPTYKFIPGTPQYDDRVGAKIRAPAWCDRILWRLHHNHDICVLLDYRCADSVQISDHRPVAAHFEVGARIADLDKEREVYQEQLHYLDKMDNEMTPSLNIEGLMANFGPIKPMIPAVLPLLLENNGGVLVSWELLPKPDETILHRPWISFSRTRGILAPKETMEVAVTIDINPVTAPDIIDGGIENLDDIAILSVKNGRHFFCVINATLSADDLLPLQRQQIQQRLGAVSPTDTPEPGAHESELDYGNLYPAGDA